MCRLLLNIGRYRVIIVTCMWERLVLACKVEEKLAGQLELEDVESDARQGHSGSSRSRTRSRNRLAGTSRNTPKDRSGGVLRDGKMTAMVQ